MILSMNPGHFTKSGHFIVLRGITSDGKILVNDHSLIKYGGIKNGLTEKIIAVIGFNSNIDFGIDILRI